MEEKTIDNMSVEELRDQLYLLHGMLYFYCKQENITNMKINLPNKGNISLFFNHVDLPEGGSQVEVSLQPFKEITH